MREDTVFSPSFGNRPLSLVGRELEVRELLDGLAQAPGSKGRSVVLLGQRGAGKTVLLWELRDRAIEQGFVVTTPTSVSEGMLERIVEKVQENGARFVSDSSPRLSGGSVGVLGFSVGLEFTRDVQETKTPQFKLTQLVRKLNQMGHGVLILIDELQANSIEVRQLVSVYQEQIGEGLNVALVMAGLPGAVSATLNDRVLTFLNRAHKMQLGPLRLDDVRAFFTKAFGSLGVRITEDQMRESVEFTQGSPYLLQLVGHNIVVYAEESGEISEGQLQAALSAAKSDFENDVCETTLRSLSDKDVEFLVAMSHDSGFSSVASVAERMKVTVDYAQKYRRRLIDSGVIECPRRGRLTFAVPYLRDWLRHRML